MDTADRLALHELPGRYGDCIDSRDWDGLAAIFTPDAVFDLSDLGAPVLRGLAEIQRFMATDADHPLTHLMTNIYVDETPDGVRTNFRLVAKLPENRLASGAYRDLVVKTPDGWRVKHRVFRVLRKPAAKGDPTLR